MIGLQDGNFRYNIKRKNYTLSDFSEESTYYQLDLGLNSTDKLSVLIVTINTA